MSGECVNIRLFFRGGHFTYSARTSVLLFSDKAIPEPQIAEQQELQSRFCFANSGNSIQQSRFCFANSGNSVQQSRFCFVCF